MIEDILQTEWGEINTAVSNNNNNNNNNNNSNSKNQERRTATSRTINKRGQSSASFVKVLTSQTNALSANNQPVEKRVVTKKRDMHT